jgi:hypothetical protein
MIIIILIELFIIYKWWNFCDFDDFSEGIGNLIALLIFGLLGMIASVCITGTIGLCLPSTLKLCSIHNLVSVSTRDGVSGNFFLGIGSVDSQQYYFYMEKVEEGFVPRKKEITDEILIKESNTIQPKLEEYMPSYRNKILYLFALPIFHDSKYIFTIPKGSIENNFIMQ